MNTDAVGSAGFARTLTRVSYYEPILQELQQLLSEPEPSRGSLFAIRDRVAALDRYYGSDAWKQDYAADEAGLLPADLKRGVLSEDGIYHAVTRYRELLSEERQL